MSMKFKNTTFPIRLVGAAAALGLLAATAGFAFTSAPPPFPAGPGAQEERENDAEVRVGTYEPQVAFQSYHRFESFSVEMQDLQRQMAEAQQQGDQQRAVELQQQMQQKQNEIVSRFYEEVEAALPSIAEEQDIQIVALEVVYTAPELDEPKDLTADLIKQVNDNAEPDRGPQGPQGPTPGPDQPPHPW